MDESRDRAAQIFLEAVELADEDRNAFLQKACGDNTALQDEVRSLLHHDAQPCLLDVFDPAAPGSLPDLPSTIGLYRLLHILGEGGMGVVFLAEQERPIRRRVALKIIKLGMDTKEVLARFDSERQALAMMNHPHIAKILDAGATEEGRPYFVMDYVDGKPITAYCDEHRLPNRQRLELFLTACEALHHAHQKGIIHRDIKPSNLLIAEDNGKPLLTVIDFGVAKAIRQRLTEHTLATQEGVLIGTPQYMSPEQAQLTGEDLDITSDIYSLGVVLYELLVGVVPVDPERLRDAGYDEMRRILREEDPPTPSTRVKTLGDSSVEAAEHRQTNPSMLRRALQGDLDWITMKALERQPERRYATAADLAADLRRHLAGETVLARPPSMVYSVSKFGRRHRGAILAAVLAVVALAVGWVASLQLTPGPVAGAAAATSLPRIAVIPFDDSGRPDNYYIAAGITEEITARLAQVSGLDVLSGAGALRYDGTDRSLQQLGEDLGVDYLLQGTVHWAQDAQGETQVRIIPQLIRAADATHVWAQPYDSTGKDILRVQSDIATQIAAELGVALLEPELDALALQPTANFEAYTAYLTGLHHKFLDRAGTINTNLLPNLQEAAKMFQLAVDLDPGFTEAWAELSMAHSRMWWGGVHTEEVEQETLQAANKALALDPESAKAHQAMGFYHRYVRNDPERGLEEFRIAYARMPNDFMITAAMGHALGHMGRLEEALPYLEQASAMNPTEPSLAGGLGMTYFLMRRYDQALQQMDRAMGLQPESWALKLQKIWVYWYGKGNAGNARAVFEAMPEEQQALPPVAFFRIELEIATGNYEEALQRIAAQPTDWLHGEPRLLLTAKIHRLRNEPQQAREHFEAARELLEAQLEAQPGNPNVRSFLGVAYAGLGRHEEAISAGRETFAARPGAGTDPPINLARIYTLLGEWDAALDQLELMLSRPYFISIAYLKYDRVWEPLWDHPRFRELQEQFG